MLERVLLTTVAGVGAVLLACGVALGADPSGALDANNFDATIDGSIRVSQRPPEAVLAQTFVPQKSGALTDARVWVGTGGDTGGLTVEVRALDQSGAPTGGVLASDGIPDTEINGDTIYREGYATANFAGPPQVRAGRGYAIVMSGDSIEDHYWSTVQQDYPNGHAYANVDGEGWMRKTYDMYFGVYVEDNVGPTVVATTPAPDAKRAPRDAVVSVTFSEKMDAASIGPDSFELYRVRADGTREPVTDVGVSLGPGGLKATLDPYPADPARRLAPNARYRVVVTTGAADEVGNALDQDRSRAGNQPKIWSFTTRR